MPRKKKQIKDPYIPSKYQKAILDFVQNGQGNAVIEAQPGSGKSRSAIECLKIIPQGQKILVTAFNTDIVEDLKKKIKKEKVEGLIDCRTIHSLGYMILMANYGKEIDRKPNDFKYPAYIYNNIKELGGDDYKKLGSWDDKKQYVENIKTLVNFGRYFLCQSEKDLEEVEKKYAITCLGEEKKIALEVMDWGKEHYQEIDFTDMIWLPIVLNCKPYGHIYDWIICDEAQDLETEERELLLRCTKMSTRMLWFGQKAQCINIWKGSDFKSFEELLKIPNTVSLPLSISYRCPKAVVRLANRFEPEMEPKDNAEEGEVKYNVPIDEIEDGSMVLCRNNAPLLQLYSLLTKENKPAIIRGKDIGKGLIKEIKETKEDKLNALCTKKGVFSALYNKLFTCIDNVMRKHSITMEMAMDDFEVSSLYDNIQALEAISDGLETTDELIEKIGALFSDKSTKGIQLSTIHKSKGLEADNVYICCPSLLPSPSAKEQWEKEQEANLEFVAYTRAKKKLGFLSEDEFTMYSQNRKQKVKELDDAKYQIFSLYGNKERCGVIVPNKKAAKEIISKAKEIKIEPKNSKTLNITSSVTVNDNVSSLSSITKKKKVKRRIKL